MFKRSMIAALIVLVFSPIAFADVVKIGFQYPKEGPYAVEGMHQLNAAKMAVEAINAGGGILGKNIELVTRDSQSKGDVSKKNVEEMIDNDGCVMIFGDSSSSVAIEGGKAAKAKGKIYFGTLTYSNETTEEEGHKYMFRECYNAWMSAKVLSDYLREKYSGKKFFYITADYTWGWTTEESIRTFSLTLDKKRYKHALVPSPRATDDDLKEALSKAEITAPDVLVLILFGKEMSRAITLASEMGLKEKLTAIVVPNLTQTMAESAGPKVMEGVIGALPWCWEIPYKYGYENGKKFVEKYAAEFGHYPSTTAASAYTILFQYKEAVERAKTFDSKSVVTALEGHKFTSMKDEQVWRDFDHQCVQTVYAVKCKPEREVIKDKFKQDYFEVIAAMPGNEAAKSREEWNRTRQKAAKPLELEW